MCASSQDESPGYTAGTRTILSYVRLKDDAVECGGGHVSGAVLLPRSHQLPIMVVVVVRRRVVAYASTITHQYCGVPEDYDSSHIHHTMHTVVLHSLHHVHEEVHDIILIITPLILGELT